jgi:hypothetical protein
MTYCNDLRSTSELDLKTYFKNLLVKQEILLNYLTRLLQMLEKSIKSSISIIAVNKIIRIAVNKIIIAVNKTIFLQQNEI